MYKSDFGRVDVDYLIAGNDKLISVIAAYRLVEKGYSVAYWPYMLDDYHPHLKAWSLARASTLPDKVGMLISSELGLRMESEKDVNDLVQEILEKISKTHLSDNLILLEASSLMEPMFRNGMLISPAIVNSDIEVDPEFSLIPACKIFNRLKKGINSRYDREPGRVISLVGFHHLVFTSPKTKSTPRVPEENQTCIGEAQRKTHDIEELRHADRNEDILQALAINELIRVNENGFS